MLETLEIPFGDGDAFSAVEKGVSLSAFDQQKGVPAVLLLFYCDCFDRVIRHSKNRRHPVLTNLGKKGDSTLQMV